MGPVIDQHRAFARQCFDRGNLAAAEAVCGFILEAAPADSETLQLLGTIAARIGMREHAAQHFSASLAADPDNRAAHEGLSALKAAPFLPPPQSKGPRYLIIKSWGCGFWADVSHVLGALLLAEVTNRTPLVQWGTNSLFGDGTAGNAFLNYFEPVSNATLNDVMQLQDAAYFPLKWNRQNLMEENVNKWRGRYSRAVALHFLARPEPVAVSDFYIGAADVAPWLPAGHPMHGRPLIELHRYLVEKYLRPLPWIVASCEAFQREHLGDGRFAAIHIRGSDKAVEDPDLERKNLSNLTALQAVDPSWKIFVLTDDENWLQRARDLYGDRVVTTDSRRTSGKTGLHNLGMHNRVRLGLDVMTDSYIARRADRFIGNGASNVAACIALLKNWDDGDCILDAPSQLMSRNIFIHLVR